MPGRVCVVYLLTGLFLSWRGFLIADEVCLESMPLPVVNS